MGNILLCTLIDLTVFLSLNREKRLECLESSEAHLYYIIFSLCFKKTPYCCFHVCFVIFVHVLCCAFASICSCVCTNFIFPLWAAADAGYYAVCNSVNVCPYAHKKKDREGSTFTFKTSWGGKPIHLLFSVAVSVFGVRSARSEPKCIHPLSATKPPPLPPQNWTRWHMGTEI